MLPIDNCDRILLASIRNLGGCPCPRCTVQLSEVHLFGTNRDRNNRVKLLRVDDERRRFMVKQARDFIYERNQFINSAAVERILKPLSLVPTSVRLVSVDMSRSDLYLERLLLLSLEIQFQHVFHVCG